MKKTNGMYTIVIQGKMSERQARMIANVAQAVEIMAEVDILVGMSHKIMPESPALFLKSKVAELLRY